MEIIRLVGQIYDCVDDDGAWDGVLENLFRMFDCSAASFQSYSPITGELALWSPRGFDQSWINEYQRDWHDKNPLPDAIGDFVMAIPVRLRIVPAHTDQVLGPGVYQKTHVYDRFFRQSDLADHIALPLDMTGTPTGIGLWSSHKSGRFDETQINAATTISRHLTRARHISNKLRYVKAYAIHGKLNAISDPAIIVDQHFSFLDHNDAAGSFLSDAHQFDMRSGRIVFQSDALHERVQQQFHNFVSETRPMPLTPKIGAIDIDERWSITIYELPIPTGQKYLMPQQSEYLLRFTENAFLFEKIVDGIAERFSLTQTEKEVAAMMAAGFSVPDITEKRNTKVSTTRWHVKRLFQKFEVSNQRELIRKILLQ